MPGIAQSELEALELVGPRYDLELVVNIQNRKLLVNVTVDFLEDC